MKHPGLYVPLDVNYVSDEGIRRAGIAAELIFIRGLAYAKRTKSDGYLPDYDLPVIGVGLPPDHINNAVKKLVHWELWLPVEGGWRIRSWERWNPAEDEAEKERKRAAARERKRRQREREAAEKRAAEEAAEVAPGQLKLVVGEGGSGSDSSLSDTSNVTRDVTRDSHAVTPPKRREEKRREEDKNSSSPAGEGTRRGSRKPKVEETPDFVAFYTAYPRKRERKDACKAWHQALAAGADPAHIIDAAKRLAEERRDEDPKYTPYPASWLRAGGYDDEPEQRPADPRFRGGPRADTPTREDFNNGMEVIL